MMSKTILREVLPSCCAVVLSVLLFGGLAAAQQYDSSAEQELVQMLNQERARAGQPSLQVDDRLTQAARAHSTLMAKAQQLSHQFPGEPTVSKRLAATHLRFNNDGENVAYDYSVQAVEDGLMHSPPHRANILSPNYNAVGIGVVRQGEVYWVTEDFAHRLENYSQNEAEDTIIAAWERERRQSGAGSARVVRMPELRRMACSMAKRGRLDTKGPLSLPNVSSAVAYTEGDPAKLAPNAIKLARDRNVTRFGVGACFGDDSQFPAGAWWVAMVFY